MLSVSQSFPCRLLPENYILPAAGNLKFLASLCLDSLGVLHCFSKQARISFCAALHEYKRFVRKKTDSPVVAMLLDGAISVNESAREAADKQSILSHVLKWAGISKQVKCFIKLKKLLLL